MKIARSFATFACVLAISSCGAIQLSGPDAAISIEQDLVYSAGETRNGPKPLLMDVYQSSAPCETLKPLVVIIHGGAFVRGSKTQSGWDERARDAARRGYVAAAINYRLIPDLPVISDEFQPVLSDLIDAKADLPSNVHPLDEYAGGVAAAIEDTVAALRFLVEDAPAERCIDTTKIGLWGGSAGAIAALHVAYGLEGHDIAFPQPDVVVDYWGLMFQDGMLRANDPPLFILHGGRDDRVTPEGAYDLKAQADAMGVDTAFYMVANAGHGYSGIRLHDPEQSVNGVTLLTLTLDFLDAHLQPDAPPPVYEAVTIE